MYWFDFELPHFIIFDFITMITEAQIELIDGLCKKYDNDKASEGEILKSVSFVLYDHRKLLESAVEMMGEDAQSCGVKQFASNSCGRRCWKVKGSHDKDYTCLKNFCSCPSYSMQARQTNNEVICKHLLAIKLASMLGWIETELISDERFVEILCQETSSSVFTSSKSFRQWRK